MLTADNHEPAPYQPSERVKSIEDHIVKAATHYKQGQFQSTIDLLDGDTDESYDFAQQHGIDYTHENVPRFLEGKLTDSQHLWTIIYTILAKSHASTDHDLELPMLDIYLNRQKVAEKDFPPLWKKVHALCLLEEWIHIKDQSIDNETNTPPGTNDHENQAALYLHHNLGIKLPKYFLEGYERSSLKLPVEDHDFDSVEI